ncbi:MAG: hypothetical protein HYY06_20950 [Deltaproteobacteria bacterium]|nr:hypothetical protein [Deltaproteobacteria bacterium]
MQPLRLLHPEAHRSGSTLLFLGLALVIAGCGDDDGDDCPAEGDADCSAAHDVEGSFDVGTGDPERPDFFELSADGRVDLFPGPQQGYHGFFQVRAKGICPNRVVFRRSIREPGATQVIRYQEDRFRLVDDGAGSFTLPRGQATFICPSNAPGVAMGGRELDLEVALVEEPSECDELAPRTITTRVTIVPTCAESDTLCSEDWVAGCAAPPE